MVNRTRIKVLGNYFKIICLFLIFSFSFNRAKAQDKIYKTDSTIVEANVSEITDSDIKYTKFSNPNGPKYTISKAKVKMIIYQNGEKEVFNNEPAQNIQTTQTNQTTQTTQANQTTQSTNFVAKDSLTFLEDLWGVKFENTLEKGGGIRIVKLEYYSIFKPGTPLKKLIVLNVKNGEEPVRVMNTSDLTKVVFASYNQGISKVNLYAGKNRMSQLSYYTIDEKGIDIAGISKFQGDNTAIKKLGLVESKKAGYTVSGFYSPSKGWYMQGFCMGMLFGLPGIALVGLAALVPPNMPSIPPNVDADSWFKGYKSRINKKRLITGMIGGVLGSVLVISAFSSN